MWRMVSIVCRGHVRHYYIVFAREAEGARTGPTLLGIKEESGARATSLGESLHTISENFSLLGATSSAQRAGRGLWEQAA